MPRGQGEAAPQRCAEDNRRETRCEARGHVGNTKPALASLPQGQRFEGERREGRVSRPRNPTMTSRRAWGWGSQRARITVKSPMANEPVTLIVKVAHGNCGPVQRLIKTPNE